MIWLAGAASILLLALLAAGLVDLIRNRQTMETRLVIVWLVLLVLLPVIGLVTYLFWRIARSEAMQNAIDFEDMHSVSSKPYPPVGR